MGTKAPRTLAFLAKFNPYHDRRGRFTTGPTLRGGAGIGPGPETIGSNRRGDKRRQAGQNTRKLIDLTGDERPLGVTAAGDIYEHILANNSDARRLFVGYLGGAARQTGGLRNSAFDHQVGKAVIELKTMSSTNGRLKTSIGKKSLANKRKWLRDNPGHEEHTVAQVVDQSRLTVRLYGVRGLRSANVVNTSGKPSIFEFIGEYTFTPAQYRRARAHALRKNGTLEKAMTALDWRDNLDEYELVKADTLEGSWQPGDTDDLTGEEIEPGDLVIEKIDDNIIAYVAGAEEEDELEELAEEGLEKFSWDAPISKLDEDRHLVFGWANVITKKDGTIVIDRQEDFIDDVEELEKAAYDFVLHGREGGEMHLRTGVSQLVESMVFTPEKLEKMGVPPGVVPTGWWVGYKVNDSGVWEDVKKGKYRAFSVHGAGIRSKVASIGKSNEEPESEFRQRFRRGEPLI